MLGPSSLSKRTCNGKSSNNSMVLHHVMKLFEIGPDDDGWPHDYRFDAVHRWGLPGIECPVCKNTWGGVGPSYPKLNLPTHLDSKPYEDVSPVTPERFEALKKPLRELLG